MPDYKIPGVYIEEIPKFPPSVAQVETAIPAFIGNTQNDTDASGNSLDKKPIRISSFKDYERIFGSAPVPNVTQINLDAGLNFIGATLTIGHYLYDSVRLFYLNGGGDCYIVSVGTYASPGTASDYNDLSTGALKALEGVDEPTILLFPDAVKLGSSLYGIQQSALLQCGTLKDRITICDLESDDPLGTKASGFRDSIGINNLKYGAAYTPWLRVAPPKNIRYGDIDGTIISIDGGAAVALNSNSVHGGNADVQALFDNYDTLLGGSPTEEQIAEAEQALIEGFAPYKALLAGLNTVENLFPPSGAVAGVMAFVDRTRGVWKAPANVSLNGVLGPSAAFTQAQLEALNVDTNAGKSINAIRAFTGKGTLIWGARTLAGNDNEWRYVPVRRFMNMVEESVKKACEQFVFEPNDANTWVRVRAMIENFLTLQWRDGALQGAKAEHAFFVEVGLGKTMTPQDILEGRMIVEIGVAPVRPAEFIILRFSQKMAES
ncbi:MAG: phage tail sheath family protein [Phaeodactylibacter sp.]|nr:phage tail sheath family protein [Phaeodactylibacter sp.]MCB9049777.1 phage tail sheath family protein [Lewinellaceae bacterium]